MPTLIHVDVPCSSMRPFLLAVGVLLVALVLGAGCSTPETASYQKHGLSFDYPPAWNLTSDEADAGGNVTLTFDTGGGSMFYFSTTPNLSTAFPATDRLDTLDRWFTESRAHLLNVGAVVIEETQVSVDGTPAHRLLYAIRSEETAYRNILVVTARDDVGYSFHLWALPAAHEEMAAGLQTVLTTFRVG